MNEFDWLPDDQLHVVETLAHVDSLIERAGDMHYAYLDANPYDMTEKNDGTTTTVTISSVRPLPAALSRTVADIGNQLRGAMEHALTVEVRRAESRDLTQRELRAIEMPAADKYADLHSWFNESRRRSLDCLRPGRPLARRIESLQPYHRRVVAAHPLRRLVEYTNAFKHRAPAVAATRMRHVVAEAGDPGMVPGPDAGAARPVRVGDVVATAPAGSVTLLAVWPEISLERPSNGDLVNLMYELRDLEEWVRAAAIPILVAGTADVPTLRTRIDLTVGQEDLRVAMRDAPDETAMSLDARRLRAHVARMNLPDTVLAAEAGTLAQAVAWTASLTDDDVLRWTEKLIEGRSDRDQIVKLQNDLQAAVANFISTEGG